MKDEQEVVGEEERKINSVTKAVKDYIWKLFLNFSRKWGTPITPTKGNSGKQLLESKSFPFLNISIFEKGIPFFCFVKDSQGVARQLCLKCNHYKTQITQICELNYTLCIWTKESDLYFLEQFLPLLGNQALCQSWFSATPTHTGQAAGWTKCTWVTQDHLHQQLPISLGTCIPCVCHTFRIMK